MKCPNCGNELEEGKLLCENCGEDVKIVPDFDIELENKLEESINIMADELSEEKISKKISDEKDKFDHDAKPELKDRLKAIFAKLCKNRKLLIAVGVIILAFCATAAIQEMSMRQMENSFDYQYGKAVAYAEQADYPNAISHLERALAINSANLDARFLLAKYYDRNGQRQSAVSQLEEILGISAGYEQRDAVYDMLLGIYEAEKEYEKMDSLLKDCDIPRIVSKYNAYAAMKPVFNKKGGDYDEIISITLAGNASGAVYYTTDGSVPTNNSPVYQTPILLESGRYTIRAKFVNAYGIESETETQHYYISLSRPECPSVNPESGIFTEPALIEAQHDGNTKIYYTTDGSVPDKNSTRYTHSFEMPYGISNFLFIAIDSSGLGSEVVSRTYNMEIDANFDEELALKVLKNNLVADGKLLNAEGSVPDKLGLNVYDVRTLAKSDGTMYYIVYEEYMDTMGKTHDTNNIYAIDVNTADLYKAYKTDEGVYDLQPYGE